MSETRKIIDCVLVIAIALLVKNSHLEIGCVAWNVTTNVYEEPISRSEQLPY